MTATIQPAPAFPPFPAAGMGLGLTFPTSSQSDLPILPPVGALMSMHMRPVARTRSADDINASRPKKATPALARFAADWGRLSRTHTRFADGAAILQKINPRSLDNTAIEVHPQAPRSPAPGNMGALLRSSELDLVHTELDHLHPDRCVCAAGAEADFAGVHAALEAGEPLVLGIHAPLQDGLGAIQPPIRLPGHQHSSAVVLGAGAIARTTTPLKAPVLTRQVAGRALVVFWTPVAQRKIPAGTAFMASINRTMAGATLRSVTLAAGQWCVLPKGSVYVTLALGDNQDGGTSTFAVQVKFAIHLPASLGADVTARAGEKRKIFEEDRYSSQSSCASSYAGSACGDCTCENDGEECYECRAGRRSKRARTAEEDDRYDFTTPVDYKVTRTRDSIADFPASSPSSLAHYSINSKSFNTNMYL